MKKDNEKYTFEIHSVDVFPDFFEITATKTRVVGNEEPTINEDVYILEFKKGENRNDEITRFIATWMYENKKVKCPGKEIKKSLKLEEKDFENKVYHSYWNVLNSEDRVEGKRVFILKNKEDGEIIDNGKIRFALSQAIFKKNNGKISDNSLFWLGDERKTKITICLDAGDDKFFRFIVKTEDLNYTHLKTPKYFNIREAEEDMFYVERQENVELASHIKEGCSVLVKGPMKVGKTRLVFEELRKLKDYYVFSLYQLAFQQADELSFPPNFNEENNNIIWFIDDIHYFSNAVDSLWSIYEKIVSKLDDVIVIATLRANEDIESHLTKDMEILNVSTWDEEEGEKLSNHYGYPKSRFAGTPFSLIKDINKMKELYNSKQINLDCRYVFRYLKLLNEFLQFVEWDLLKKVYEFLREKSKGTDDFEESSIALESAGFIDRRGDFVLSWEPYLEDIVIQEDYPQINFDMERLLSLFSELKDFSLLMDLGGYFYKNNFFENAIDCSRQVINITESGKDIKFTGYSYNNWGIALSDFAKLDGDPEKLEEAIEKYKLAIEIDPKDATAYCACGVALSALAKLDGDPGKLEEAIEKYKKSIEIDPKFAGVYLNWGIALADLAKLTNNIDLEKITNKYEMAFLLFISQKEWEYAEAIASYRILNGDGRPKDKALGMHKIAFVFNIALSFILDPREMSNDELKGLRYMNEKFGTVESITIVSEAILENKKPGIKVDPESDNLWLNAAIVLANEIVAISFSSA